MATTIHYGSVIESYSASLMLFPLNFSSELGMQTATRWVSSSPRLSACKTPWT